jgi:hypothetical protein
MSAGSRVMAVLPIFAVKSFFTAGLSAAGYRLPG